MFVEELKDKREWETFLSASPEGTFFHSLKWKEVIEKSFPHSPLYLTIRDANGTIVGICPSFILNSMRMKNKGTMEIDLKATPSDFIWNKIFSKNRRRKIRRIERDGFQAREARTKSDLRDFYTLYYENMKYIGGSPYPYKFMENMWSILYPENLRIWLVEKDKIIAGISVLKYERKTYWTYAGINRKQCGRASVVPYLLWKEIDKAEEEGCRWISLGGTSSDPKNPYHIQKKWLGASFCQQEMVWYPFSPNGRILLQTRAKAVSAWKTFKNFLPHGLKGVLESKLSRF